MASLSDSDSFVSDDGRVEVVFDIDELPQALQSLVMDAAVAALDAEHRDGPDRITVMITGDERIRELNREFKDEDEVTDVLSFNEPGSPANDTDPSPQVASSDAWPDFDGPEDVESDRLGDIAISLAQVERQAEENGKSAESELAMLTIHGVLHLLGYDHAEPDEEQVMFGKTDVILSGVPGV